MSSDSNTDRLLSSGGTINSVTRSTALLNRKLGTSPAPRTLTASEIELLQRSKREMARVAHEILTTEPGASKA